MGGCAHAGNGRHVLGAGAPVALLASAGGKRHQTHAAAYPQGARALGAAELVGRDRQQIDAERLHVDRQFAGRLDGVGVEQRAPASGQRGQRRDRLHGADLVVGVHHRHDRRAIGEGRGEGVRLDDAALTDRQQRDLPAAPGQRLDRLQHRFVLDARGDHVVPAARLERLGGAADGGVVAFRAAGREHHFGGLGADERGDGGARVVEHGFGLLTEMVHARGVAPGVGRHRGEARQRRRGQRRGGVVVEIDAGHGTTIVALALTLSNKRARHLFPTTPILTALRAVTHLPGDLGEQRGQASARLGRFHQCGSVTSRPSRQQHRHRHRHRHPRQRRRRTALPSLVAAIIAPRLRGTT